MGKTKPKHKMEQPIQNSKNNMNTRNPRDHKEASRRMVTMNMKHEEHNWKLKQVVMKEKNRVIAPKIINPQSRRKILQAQQPRI